MSRFRLIPQGLLLCSALAFASFVATGARAGENHDGFDHDVPPPDGAANVRQKLAAKFDVDESVISRLRNRGLGYGEIDHTLTLASGMPDGLTKQNVRQVLELRQEQQLGWGQIAHELDTTMGAAKRDFRAAPPPSDDPGMHDGPGMHRQPGSDSPGVQPTSVSRPGKSSFAKARGTSAGRLGGKSLASSGSKSGGRISGASAGRANGHAFGRAASHGSGAKGGGKAKGRK